VKRQKEGRRKTQTPRQYPISLFTSKEKERKNAKDRGKKKKDVVKLFGG